MTAPDAPSGCAPADRAEALHRDATDTVAEGVWFAPGRVNLIGEHTDYNDGFVLPFALPQGVGTAASRRADDRIVVRSAQASDAVEIDLTALRPGSVEGWGAYVAGVAWALREAGVEVAGVDLTLDSDVPSGAGLSSSHALECSVALALLGLAGESMDRTVLADLIRTAENDYVGAPTGIMDQMASLHGSDGHVLFLDTRALVVEEVPFDLARDGLALLVVDTRAPHALVSGEYAERRAACEEGARVLGVPALRDVAMLGLEDALARIEDPVVRRRVRHVVTENARVLATVEVLRSGRPVGEIGPLLTASHVSMRDDFEITVPQVDTAVEAALAAGALGSRMTGGGFGGCVLALVAHSEVDAVSAAVTEAFAAAGFDRPRTFVTGPSAGARQVR